MGCYFLAVSNKHCQMNQKDQTVHGSIAIDKYGERHTYTDKFTVRNRTGRNLIKINKFSIELENCDWARYIIFS